MVTNLLSIDSSGHAQYAIWIVTLVLVAFGFRYAKEVIALVLDELYAFFIERKVMG